MFSADVRIRLVAHSCCLLTLLAVLWLANPLIHETIRILAGRPVAVLITVSGLALLAVTGLVWAASLRRWPLTTEGDRMGRELLRGLLLGLIAHGAESMTTSLLIWLQTLRSG